MTAITDETLGALLGLAIHTPQQVQAMGYEKMTEAGKVFLAQKPQLRESLENSFFTAHQRLGVSRSQMYAMTQEVIPALIREFAMFAVDQKVGGGPGTMTPPGKQISTRQKGS